MLVLVFFAFLFDECSRSCSLENKHGWTFYLAITCVVSNYLPSQILLEKFTKSLKAEKSDYFIF